MEYSQADQDTLVVLLTNGKKNGWYLEIGANDPVIHNNTFRLEKDYQWRGLMVEFDSSFQNAYNIQRPLAYYSIGDATQLDYYNLLSHYQFPSKIDYLQIDLDVDNRSTLTTLELLDATIFNHYTFGVVTFEHDIYRGNFFNTHHLSRQIFDRHGYIRIFGNVSVFFEGKWCSFEDWYAHPSMIDSNLLNKICNHPDNKEGLTHTSCINIIHSIFSNYKMI